MFTALKQKKISLGEFELEPEKRLLTLNGTSVHLSNRPFQVLLYLIENRDRVVSRMELLDKFWDGREVYEVALSKCVGAIRKALGDRLDEPRFIETRWAEGYRFIYEIENYKETPESSEVENGGQGETNLPVGETAEPDNSNGSVDILRTNGLANPLAHPAVAENKSDQSPVHPAKQSNVVWQKHKVLIVLVLCAVVILIPAAIWLRNHRSNSKNTQPVMIRSIAVIPIKNLTGDSEQDYLADGMTESLIASLSRIDGLKVSSRGSVFTFKNKEADPKQIGELLGVEALLEGSMQRNGESLRVEVRLVSTKDGSVLWSGETHERSMKNIIALQDEIARSVVVKLSGGQNQTLARGYTKNEEAHHLYQKGRFFWNKRTGQGFSKAIEYFNQAIALDPNYALAFAGLADCYMLISPYGMGKPHENFPKAKEAAEKALAIDPDLAEAHASLGHLAYLYEWNWAKAEESFKRAIKLNPNNALAHQWYANFLSSMGRHEEALSSIKRAQELDPFSIAISRDNARVYYHAKDYDRAIEQGLKILELDSNLVSYNSWLDMAYAQKGLYEKAIEQRLGFYTYKKVEEEKIAALKKAFKENGWTGYCREELNQSLQRIKEGKYVLPYNMARSYARLGEKEQTLEWLEKCYAEHSDHLVLLKADPLFDFIRQDARFQDLMHRVGFN